jgi:hypothetical protein
VIQAEIEQRLQEATLTHLPDADRSPRFGASMR